MFKNGKLLNLQLDFKGINMATAKKTVAKKVPAKKAPAKAEPKLKVSGSAKTAATKKGEPYVTVVSVELDPDNVGNGAFELDWNEIFVARLVKAGYQGKDDAAIVDRWFQDICRNVIMENYEQWEANQAPETRIVQRRDLGDGRSEVS
jgi:hypothetical protein